MQVDLGDWFGGDVLDDGNTAALDAAFRRIDVYRRVERDGLRHRKLLILLVALFVVGLQYVAVFRGLIAVQHVGVVVDPRTERGCERDSNAVTIRTGTVKRCRAISS